jgi:hypothetical protein
MSSVGDCYLVIIDLDLYFDEIAKSKTVVQFALHAAYPPIELGDLRVAYLSGRQSKVRSSQPAKVCLRDALGEAPASRREAKRASAARLLGACWVSFVRIVAAR